MATFRTEIKIRREPRIDHRARLLTIGSCFADNIGERLSGNKFKTLVNPLGTVYNPVAIHHQLTDAIRATSPRENLYVHHDGVWSHYHYHSKWSAASKEHLASGLKPAIAKTTEWLRETRFLIITYGTAWVYIHRDTGELVANCHKVPAAVFEKNLLTIEQIVDDFRALHRELKAIQPEITIILTISPVRHLRDTLEGNQVSKSVIRLACHELTNTIPGVVYFPAYEIVLDDLRDYRFYEADLIHPTPVAIDYVWERFMDSFVTDDARVLIEKWTVVKKALAHRPFQPGSAAHEKFRSDTLAKLKELSPYLDVEADIDAFTNSPKQ